MIDALASDLAVTWLGAVACWLYCSFLWRTRESHGTAGTALFLVATLGVLLTVRGFFWIFPGPALGRAVFAAATLLPVAITLFVEQLLRRHHPRWLKILAAAFTAVFFTLNLVADLPNNPRLLLSFLMGFALVVAGNGWFLAWARRSDLSHNERQVVRAILFATVLAVPLLATDFREELAGIPARLGALGALVYVYVLLSLIDAESVALALVRRLAFAVVCGGLLAVIFAFTIVPRGTSPALAVLSGMPVGVACALLGVIIARMVSISSMSEGNRFLRWLLHARLDTVEGFVRSLQRLAQTAHHVVLTPDRLVGYSLDRLFDLALGRRESISLGEARAWTRAGDRRVEGAEQLVDLLERHEMTHALLIRRNPALIVLLNLPEGAHAAVGQLRAGVIQRLARRLSAGERAA